ncbi:MAG: tRNA pseudouridine(55) synthase TruB [Candidatus Omnitrophica bacterium]|jgi:tRNA pseudouridine55 synthase|nr:tRNA pseudouridine(55) synthase TruB [Candidatus Omnitrophota bacterium]MDD5079654.1 tRNA pseudouridine(55) synthase TruB [Candidatus Omnitrophota bacterium]
MKDGIIVINKPKGMTSHDVVDFVRKKLKMRKVGHAGTLDPAATGVLVILLGRCTRLFDKFLSYDKEYVATLTLGSRTSSGDLEGDVLETRDYNHIDENMVKNAMPAYIGDIKQVPPMVSAVKYKGKRLYKLARKGQQVERTPRDVRIKELKLLEFKLPDVEFYLKCSRGTYVRQLAEDLAVDLNCVGHVSRIERLSIGPFNIKSALGLSDIEESRIQPFFG